MARKATDLLDVFRFNSEDGHDNRDRKPRKTKTAARSSTRKPAKRSKPKSAASSFDGIHLGPRQLLLASSAGLLLLVLSFTLGLAAGRPDSGSEQAPSALARQSNFVAIRTEISLVDPATRKRTDPRKVRALLVKDFRVPSKNLRIFEEAGQLVLQVGPFRTEQAANDFRQRTGLEFARINMEEPFRWPSIVPYRR